MTEAGLHMKAMNLNHRRTEILRVLMNAEGPMRTGQIAARIPCPHGVGRTNWKIRNFTAKRMLVQMENEGMLAQPEPNVWVPTAIGNGIMRVVMGV